MGVRMPETLGDAKELLMETLGTSTRLIIKKYGSQAARIADLKAYSVSNYTEEDSDNYANFILDLVYSEMLFGANERLGLVDKTRTIVVLSNLGDNDWTFNMIHKVWNGDYPSTVGVDMTTGDIFLLNIRSNCLELIEFGQFTEEQLEHFLLERNDREPFALKLEERAMFAVLDGAEGINHLRDNVVVTFNCGVPLKVKAKEKGVI